MPAPRALGAALALALPVTLLTAVASPAVAAPSDPAPTRTMPTAVDPLARYVGQVSCDPTAKPGSTALSQVVLASYGLGRNGGITRACTQGGVSEHKEGRAWDWMLDSNDVAQKAVGDRFVTWLTGPDAQGVSAGNARRLGVMYVIWNRRIWEAYRATESPGSGWKSYTGTSPHTASMHVSLSWDGAMKRTSWWTGRVVTVQDLGPCRVYIGEPAPAYSGPRYGSCPAPVPRQAEWWVRGVAGPGAGMATSVFTYGSGGDRVLACDFDGDGRDGVVVYRAGTWSARSTASAGTPDKVISYGAGNMLPACGDWDGDGKDGIGVFDGTHWWLRNTSTPGAPDLYFQYGWPGAGYIVGDWDGDGTDTIGVYDGAHWWLRNTNTPGAPDLYFQYGWPGVRLVTGDWDGDGTDGVGVVGGGGWWLRETATAGAPDYRFDYGWPGVVPVAGRWVDDQRHGVAIVNGAG